MMVRISAGEAFNIELMLFATVPADSSDEGAAPDESQSMLKASEHPRYSYYFQQLAEGRARFVLERRMQTAGLDPEILDRPDELIPAFDRIALEPSPDIPPPQEPVAPPEALDALIRAEEEVARAREETHHARAREQELAEQTHILRSAERVGMLEPPPPGNVVPAPPAMTAQQQPPPGFPVAQPPVQTHVQQAPPATVIVGQLPSVIAGSPYLSAATLPITSATTALVLSILSVFCGGICLAIPALIVAQNALKITDAYPGHPDAGSAKAAKIVSWIVIGLSLIFILMMMV
jgi:hypothetical protein